MKSCRTCGVAKTLDLFTPHKRCHLGVYPDCKVCRAASARAKYRRDREKILDGQRRARARRPPKPEGRRKLNRYGITAAEFLAMVEEQEGKCAICLMTPDVLVIDHCHRTGVVRGLLCRSCNLGLGSFGDDPERLERAHLYAERWRRGRTRQS